MFRFLIPLLIAAFVPHCYGQNDPQCAHNRTTFVHLFEWKWTDIAAECERFLGPYGYCGIQVSPPNEHRIVTSPFRPWWERYQPVSYKLNSRSGSDAQFRDMVNRCNAAGVRIYVDAIINHMAGVGHSGQGSGGTFFDSGKQSFPGVPYSAWDFHGRSECPTSSLNIENYNDRRQVQNCRLLGLADLMTGKDYVRGSIAGYLNNLISIGVAGFRIDAAKHMPAHDLANILSRLTNLKSDVFGHNKRPFVFHEVIEAPSEPVKPTEYIGTGRVTEFRQGIHIGRGFQRQFTLKNFRNFGSAWGMLSSDQAVVFIDNHDNQRGHGGGGNVLTHKNPKLYKAGTAFELAWPYGFPKVMSSYSFNGGDQGPPAHGDGSTMDVQVNSDLTCGNGWMCEHRWRQIYNMAGFRNMAGSAPVSNWWDNGGNQIAFSRGGNAFIAFNNEGYDLNVNLQTGLPAGSYCDIISGNKMGGGCEGRTINVGGDGKAQIYVGSQDEDAMVAIHLGSRL